MNIEEEIEYFINKSTSDESENSSKESEESEELGEPKEYNKNCEYCNEKIEQKWYVFD